MSDRHNKRVPMPDPECCVHVVAKNDRVTRWYQCNRKPTVWIDGHHLCRQHADKASKVGSMEVITGWKPDSKEYEYVPFESKTLPVQIDPALRRAKLEREIEKARFEIAGLDRARKYEMLLELAMSRHDDPEIRALMDAHPVDAIRAVDPKFPFFWLDSLQRELDELNGGEG